MHQVLDFSFFVDDNFLNKSMVGSELFIWIRILQKYVLMFPYLQHFSFVCNLLGLI